MAAGKLHDLEARRVGAGCLRDLWPDMSGQVSCVILGLDMSWTVGKLRDLGARHGRAGNLRDLGAIDMSETACNLRDRLARHVGAGNLRDLGAGHGAGR